MKDFVDTNNKPVKCTDEIKQVIFDNQTKKQQFADIVAFVTQISLGIQAEKEKQEKNS